MFTLSTSSEPYHHGQLRQALLDAATAMLEAGEPLSWRALARRTGVSAAAPYRHFASLEELRAEVAACGFDALAAALRAGDAAPEPLLGQGVAYVEFACAHPALFRLMFGAAAPECAGRAGEAGQAALALLQSRAGDAALTLSLWALVHGLAMLLIDHRLPSMDRAAIETVLRAQTPL